jgi:hypothetical protein
VDFTREPIIETIVTPKDGYNLVVRSSKNSGQDEYFVEAVEIVSFGGALFFRSQEKSKAFLVPVSDYEVVEVREARMVLKNATIERNVKIGGGKENKESPPKEASIKENVSKQAKEFDKESGKEEKIVRDEADEASVELESSSQGKAELKGKKERRGRYRRKRGRDDKEDLKDESEEISTVSESESTNENKDRVHNKVKDTSKNQDILPNPVVLSALLQPPPRLISETISDYKKNELFKGAFYLNEEDHYKPHDKVQELLDDEKDIDVDTGTFNGSDEFDRSDESHGKEIGSFESTRQNENIDDRPLDTQDAEDVQDERNTEDARNVHDVGEGDMHAMVDPEDAENAEEIVLPPIPSSYRGFPFDEEEVEVEKPE